MKTSYKKKQSGKKSSSKPGLADAETKKNEKEEYTRLNKFIASTGLCSRREADKLIHGGKIKVNQKVITEMGYKVHVNDKVMYKDKVLKKEKPIYVLLNKPKDFITTTSDPKERKTVMRLVARACTERIFPVGRLDRNTTGLLLLTNDGDLAKKLAHPSYGVKKIYQVTLDKPLTKADLEQIKKGISLDDGPVVVDDIAVVSENRKTIGLELHIGRNRIVRRIFEYFGYKIVKLDRVMYASLTKENLPRGKWRFLTTTEVLQLKQIRKL